MKLILVEKKTRSMEKKQRLPKKKMQKCQEKKPLSDPPDAIYQADILVADSIDTADSLRVSGS